MSIARVLRDAERHGNRDAKIYRSQGSKAGSLGLGGFGANSRPGALLLRRLLLSLHVPPRVLVWAKALVHGSGSVSAEGFLWRYSYWRGVRRGLRDRQTWRRLNRAPVILMYHAIGGASEPASCYVVPGRLFRLQMAWLRLRRYRLISLSDLVDHLRSNRLPPARAIVVTFDDGYQDNFHVAFPVLRALRIPATIFLVADALAGRAAWTSEPALCGRRLLTPDQIREMAAAGIEVGAHTRTHISLADVRGHADREREIAGSREMLEGLLGRPVTTFAYPFGDYDPDVVQIVRHAGFHAACCSRSGPNDPVTPIFELRRVEIRGTDSLIDFALMVWSGRRRKRAARTGNAAAMPQASRDAER